MICHGAPSPALWKKYAEYQEKKNCGKLKGINFRCKDDSWTDFGMKEVLTEIPQSKAKQLYISKDEDSYMQMFLRDYCLRPSCYDCVAKKVKMEDLTIADFWGINEVAPEMNDGNGTSLVLIRTDKGMSMCLNFLWEYCGFSIQIARKAERNCSDLFTWASTYKGASFERRQAILKQFIKEVRVGRDYNIEIVLNVPLDEFEEFKRHAASAGRGKNQKNKSQNPQKVGRCTSNAGIVVLDKTAGETISIVPKNAAHAILRC